MLGIVKVLSGVTKALKYSVCNASSVEVSTDDSKGTIWQYIQLCVAQPAKKQCHRAVCQILKQMEIEKVHIC